MRSRVWAKKIEKNSPLWNLLDIIVVIRMGGKNEGI
jgi:hypothetical protein